MANVFRGGRFILGEQTEAFEKEFAAFLGAARCIGVGSGTDALELALRACNIGPCDAVLTVAHTAVATVAAIERTGATPVLVDIDASTFTMDPNRLLETIKEYEKHRTARLPKLKAVIPVHLYGHPTDMPAILSIARARRLRVIEDCAQSHGASLSRKLTGTWGDLAAFSFYPTKNLGAFGDGGAVVTNSPSLADKVQALREYGWRRTRHVSELRGINSRLDELQAAILRVLLRDLANENAERRKLADLYGLLLAGTTLTLPQTGAHVLHSFHQYVVRSPTRTVLRPFLEARGIATQIHYPVPIHRQPAYRRRLFIGRAGLRNTEIAAREVLSLPMSPYLKREQVRHICSVIREALEIS